MKKNLWMNACAMMVAASILAGCYGRFPLTNALYDWNGSVTYNRVGQSIIMWVLVLIPVYQVCMIVDGVLINTVEYLSGRTVMSAAEPVPEGLLAFEYVNATNATLRVPLHDGTTLAVSMIRVAPSTCEVRDPQGTLLGTAVRAEDGALHLCDAQGYPVSIVEAAEIAQLRAERL